MTIQMDADLIIGMIKDLGGLTEAESHADRGEKLTKRLVGLARATMRADTAGDAATVLATAMKGVDLITSASRVDLEGAMLCAVGNLARHGLNEVEAGAESVARLAYDAAPDAMKFSSSLIKDRVLEMMAVAVKVDREARNGR